MREDESEPEGRPCGSLIRRGMSLTRQPPNGKLGSMAMEEYRRKRDFHKTPEPAALVGADGGNRFVVHRHEARNLHYDLRLEAGGVLACWAVPKGFSYTPTDKRLAVRTEDHPWSTRGSREPSPRGSTAPAP